MKTPKYYLINTVISLLAVTGLQAQETLWTLERCIESAVQNNIQVKGLLLDSLSAVSSFKQAKAAQLPALSASAQYSTSENPGQTATMTGSNNITQSTRYSLNAGWTLFAGTSIRTTVKQKEKEIVSQGLSVEQTKFDITIAVVRAYLQILYSRESLVNARQSYEASTQQYDRICQLLTAGAASSVEQTQLHSQLAADKYALVVAQNNLDTDILQMKQLLEIPPTTPFSPVFPEFSDSLSLEPLPQKHDIYTAALSTMPGMQKDTIALEIAELELKKSVAGYLPTLLLTGGLSSSHDMNSGTGGQLEDNLHTTVGLQLSVPIYDNRKAKTEKEKAGIGIEKARLGLRTTEKELLQDVETIYLNAVAARSRLEAAKQRLAATKAGYELVLEQYAEGMIQPVDLLIEKNQFLSAQTEQLQSKYSALLYTELLNLYRGRTIALPQGI